MKKILGKAYRFGWKHYDALMRFLDKRSKKPKALVLIYHRIATLEEDPLMLAVTPEHFEEHLLVLRGKFKFISLSELHLRLHTRSLQGDELCITFDDGYKDNLVTALPIAEKYNVPIAVFVTTNFIDSDPLFMTKEELITLSQHPLVTIGSHTSTHPRLRDLTYKEQLKELSEAKDILKSILKKPIEYAAYPYGGPLDWNISTLKAAKNAGYKAAFSSVERPVTSLSSRIRLARINVRDWNAGALIAVLSKFKNL